LDLVGAGGLASWAEEPLKYKPIGPLLIKPSGDLLVVLRYEESGRDVDNVRLLCPYFRKNIDWLDHIHATAEIPVRIRAHPEMKELAAKGLRSLIESWGWEWDTSESFLSACTNAKAVAVEDSTAGAQALEMNLPVLCFGRQVYRQLDAVYCLDGHKNKTHNAMQELKDGKCSLDIGAIKAMVNKIRAKQWYPKDVDQFPERLRREFGM
jgi:hypothetical protein